MKAKLPPAIKPAVPPMEDFPGSPDGWATWPYFRQTKYLEDNKEIATLYSSYMKDKGGATYTPLSEVVIPVKEEVTEEEITSEYSYVGKKKLKTGFKQATPDTSYKVPKNNTSNPTPSVKKSLTLPQEKSNEIQDLRDWNEDVDGIPAERIRNCIIYQLDYRKNKYYKDVLTVGFIKRSLGKTGVTGARRLHEDTPPGWVVPDSDPLEKTTTVIVDGKEVEKKEYRRPKNAQEKEQLLKLAFTSRGKIIPYFIPKLVIAKCVECNGTGYKEYFPYLNSKKYAHIRKTILCPCIKKV